MPQDNMMDREKREKKDYTSWVRDGWITPTPGAYIDRAFIHAKMVEDSRKYDIQEIAFDPALSRDIVPQLLADGFNMVEFRQGFLSMAPAVKAFELAALKGDLATGGNPVMKWMVAYSEIVTDAAGCGKIVKPDRNRTGKHIDGAVAATMAYYRAVENYKKKSVYDGRGVRTL
jgi:phage terminase large subunit-like protein